MLPSVGLRWDASKFESMLAEQCLSTPSMLTWQALVRSRSGSLLKALWGPNSEVWRSQSAGDRYPFEVGGGGGKPFGLYCDSLPPTSLPTHRPAKIACLLAYRRPIAPTCPQLHCGPPSRMPCLSMHKLISHTIPQRPCPLPFCRGQRPCP